MTTNLLDATAEGQNVRPPSANPETRFILPHHLDSTMLTSFRSCPRQWMYEFGMGLRPITPSIDLHAGAVFASTVARVRELHWLENMGAQDAIDYAYPHFMDEWGDFPMPNKPTNKSMDRVWVGITEYFRQWPVDTDPLQPYFTDPQPSFEFSFAIPLDFPDFPRHPIDNEPFIWVGRFDLLGKYQGFGVVEDDKSTGRGFPHNWSDQWKLRNQFLGYMWACQMSGLDVRHIMVRGIAFLKTDIKLIETPPIEYPQHKVDRWFEQLKRDLWRLVRCAESGYFDYDFGNSCTSYSGCLFVPLCEAKDETAWLSDYAVRRWNPLDLNPETQPPTKPGPQDDGSIIDM